MLLYLKSIIMVLLLLVYYELMQVVQIWLQITIGLRLLTLLYTLPPLASIGGACPARRALRPRVRPA